MKLPKTLDNPISIFGGIMATVSMTIILTLLFYSLVFDSGGPYTGLVMFIFAPSFLILGLILVPLGAYLRARRNRKTGREGRQKWRVLDLNVKKHRVALLTFLFLSLFMVVISAIGSYEAFHFTESDEFCGKTCHTVMEPEFTTYQTSSHSRVGCVQCHVGTGASSYVKSKISGLYQVYSILAKKYPQPIETPVHSLRPARETCEQCHWPQKFYPNQLVKERHYLADSSNTEWDINLRLLVGSDNEYRGLEEGIHWHINPNVKIDYIAETEEREVLPWVRYINLETGDTIIYTDSEYPPDEELLAEGEMREMDCIDCHNRPSHVYLTPQDFTNKQISLDNIPKSLPYIKQIAMEVLFSEYFTNKDTALIVIRNRIESFYQDEHPELYASQKDLIDKAIEGVLAGFTANVFPYMQASWDAYPDHIGHKVFDGCFRCHNDRHTSEAGRVISMDCNLCHTILQQGTPGNYETALFNESLEFQHPVKLKGGWQGSLCSECHRYLYE
jgi:nitrate/TMAO reductase-like tetraheme cytochrome c subunit